MPKGHGRPPAPGPGQRPQLLRRPFHRLAHRLRLARGLGPPGHRCARARRESRPRGCPRLPPLGLARPAGRSAPLPGPSSPSLASRAPLWLQSCRLSSLETLCVRVTRPAVVPLTSGLLIPGNSVAAAWSPSQPTRPRQEAQGPRSRPFPPQGDGLGAGSPGLCPPARCPPARSVAGQRRGPWGMLGGRRPGPGARSPHPHPGRGSPSGCGPAARVSTALAHRVSGPRASVWLSCWHSSAGPLRTLC